MFLRVWVLMFASLLIALPVQAETTAKVTDAYRQDVGELVGLMGGKDVVENVLDNMFTQMSQKLPNVPKEFWDKQRKDFESDKIGDILAPVYAQHLSQTDLEGLIKFYQSPLGQRVVKAMPEISRESMPAIQSWGRSVAERVRSELLKQGYLNNQPADKPAAK